MDITQLTDALGPLADKVDVNGLSEILKDPSNLSVDGLKQALGPLADKVDVDALAGKITSGDLNMDSVKEMFGKVDPSSLGDSGGLIDKAKGALGL